MLLQGGVKMAQHTIEYFRDQVLMACRMEDALLPPLPTTDMTYRKEDMIIKYTLVLAESILKRQEHLNVIGLRTPTR